MAASNGARAVLERSQKRIAAAGGCHIGDLIAWNTDRINISRLEARQLFKTEGLAHLIPDLDPATALSRAAGEVRRPDGIIVRPFASPKSDTPAAVGIYQIKARAGEVGDEYIYGARCRVDRASKSIVALAPEGSAVIEAAMSHAETVAGHANHLLSHCETKDLSAALVGTAKALSGVPLRERGGFYLLPPSTCAVWARLKPGLEQLGVRPIRIEMHDAPDNVSAAREAARGALEADIQQLMTDLEKASGEGMRQHALTRRVELCKELKAKAELYRGVLRSLTDRIGDKVQELEEGFRKYLVSMPSEPSSELAQEEEGLFEIPVHD